MKFLKFALVTLSLLFTFSFVGGAQAANGPAPTTVPAAQSNQQFSQTDNPIDIDPPVAIPSTRPVVRSILSQHAFGNAATPATNAVSMPAGHWGTVILKVTGTEQGRQFDRLMLVWINATEIFAGVTPEPTQAGITWRVQADVTAYLPTMVGTQDVTTHLENFLSSVDTGIPVVSAELDFYPPTSTAANPWQLAPPDSIVPLQTQPDMDLVSTGQSLTATITLPHDITQAYLDLYAIGQNNDEFWWANNPAFREVEVSIDNRPAGVIWPYPYIYTGGVNPLLWRPLTAIHTLNLPAYRLDLTPFAGLLGGSHTVTIQVANNASYWLLAGSLFLYEDHGHPTSGSLLSDTLAFPSTAPTTSSGILGSTSNQLLNAEASASYQIRGEVKSAYGDWTATVQSSLNFSNDQTNVNPQFWQLVHGLQNVSTDETLASHGNVFWERQSDESYTVDATSAFIQPDNNSSSDDFFLPSDVTQTLDETHSLSGSTPWSLKGAPKAYHSTLFATIQGYAALQEGNDVDTLENGASSAYANFADSLGSNYHEVLEARGGVVTLKQISGAVR